MPKQTKHLCAAPVDMVWTEASGYRERSEVFGTTLCGHSKRSHRYGLCYDCDNLDRYGGMLHPFTPGIIVDAGTLIASDKAKANRG